MNFNRSVLHPKYFTVKEWKKFDKYAEIDKIGNDCQFINFNTQYKESFESITTQEILLQKFEIILIDYKPKKYLRNKGNYFDLDGIERTDPKPTKKEIAVKVGKIIYKNANMKNFNKGMKVFDQGLKSFTDSINAFTKELGHDNNTKLWSNKKSNVQIWNKTKSAKTKNIPLWPERNKPKRRRRKSKSKEWDQRENNLERLMGKRKFKL